jgi:hypothetical protein
MPLRVCYLPWADLDTEVVVGPVSFVPLQEWIRAVNDPRIERYWDRFSRCHIGQDGKPVLKSLIAVHANASFGSISQRENLEISRAADALAFAYFAGGSLSRALPENRRPGSIPVAQPDRFALYNKSFDPMDRTATITSGGVMASWRLAQLRMQRPHHVMGGWCVEPDRDLLAGLGRIVSAGPRHPFANQIWSALEWTRLAFSGADGVIDVNRLVMMMTAYECLLAQGKAGRGGGEVKQAFKKFVDQHLHHELLRTTTRDFKSHGKHKIPLPADWFYDVFDLRGSVVHGNALRRGQGAYLGHPHLLLAVLFMWASVTAILTAKVLLPVASDDALRLAMRKLTGKSFTKKEILLHDFKNGLWKLYHALGWVRRRRRRRIIRP